MSRIVATALVAFVATTSVGCATIATGGGGRQSVSIATEPPGADIIVDGQLIGPSPVNALLSRKTEHIVEVQMPGYESAQVLIRSKFNSWVVGNIVVGGLIGVVVDVVTDATWTLSDNALKIQLQPVAIPAVDPKSTGMNATPSAALPAPTAR